MSGGRRRFASRLAGATLTLASLAAPVSAAASPPGSVPAPLACQFALLAENDIGEDVWILFSESHMMPLGDPFRKVDYFETLSNRRVAPGETLNARYEVGGRCGAPRQWFMLVRIGPRGGEKILVLRVTDAPNERDIYLGQASCWALANAWDDPDSDRVVNNDDEAAGCDPATTRYGLAPDPDEGNTGTGRRGEGPAGDGRTGGDDATGELDPAVGAPSSVALDALQGNWRRFDSNNPRNDGMRAVVEGSRATLTYLPPGGSRRFSEGDLLWRDIASDGSLQVRGSDGAYYAASLTKEGPDRINIDVHHNGPGNDQTWDRAGPTIDGEWVLAGDSDAANLGMRIEVARDRATVRYLPASASVPFRVGDLIWREIGSDGLEAMDPDRDYVTSSYRLAAGERLRVVTGGDVQTWVRPGADLEIEDPSGRDGPTDETGRDEGGDDPGACVATGLIDDVRRVSWGWGLTESDPDPGSILSALPAWEPVPERSRRVIDVERSRVSGLDDHYALIWEANTGGLDWEEERGLTGSAFTARNEAHRAAGLRLADVEVDVVGGRPELAGIWTQNVGGVDWELDPAVAPDDLGDVIEQRAAEGYRLVDIEAFPRGTGTAFALVWHWSCPGAGWDWVAGVDRQTYQNRLDAAVANGWQMIDIEAWPTPAGQRYAAIWEAPRAERDFRARSGRTLQGFLNFHRRYLDQGFRLTDYESYETEDGVRYAGIWVENDARYRDPIRPVLDSLVENYRVSADVPGMSVVVIEDGDVVYRRGFGTADRAAANWAWSGTVYLTASVSKVVGATLTARLEERGVLDLSRPTADYLEPAIGYINLDQPTAACALPSVSSSLGWACEELPDHHTHTLEQLLAKTGCVPHYDDGIDYTPDERYYRWRAEALAQVWKNDLLPNCTPGQHYHYSTPGFTFVGAVLESRTGKDIATLIQDEISRPLGLSTLRAMATEDGRHPDYDRAKAYKLDDPSIDTSASPDTLVKRAHPTTNPSVPATYEDNSWKVLGGGVESDAMDLARFGWTTLDGQIVSTTSRLWSSQTSTATRLSNGNPAPIVGLAWEMNGQRAWHSGSARGSRAGLLLAVNNGVSVAILSNRRNQKIVRYFSSGFGVRGIRALADDIMDAVLAR